MNPNGKTILLGIILVLSLVPFAKADGALGCFNITIEEKSGNPQTDAPIYAYAPYMTFSYMDELRVFNAGCGMGGTEIPRDIISNTTGLGNDNATVLFLANLTASTTINYSITFNNASAAAPVYADRVKTEGTCASADCNVTAYGDYRIYNYSLAYNDGGIRDLFVVNSNNTDMAQMNGYIFNNLYNKSGWVTSANVKNNKIKCSFTDDGVVHAQWNCSISADSINFTFYGTNMFDMDVKCTTCGSGSHLDFWDKSNLFNGTWIQSTMYSVQNITMANFSGYGVYSPFETKTDFRDFFTTAWNPNNVDYANVTLIAFANPNVDTNSMNIGYSSSAGGYKLGNGLIPIRIYMNSQNETGLKSNFNKIKDIHFDNTEIYSNPPVVSVDYTITSATIYPLITDFISPTNTNGTEAMNVTYINWNASAYLSAGIGLAVGLGKIDINGTNHTMVCFNSTILSYCTYNDSSIMSTQTRCGRVWVSNSTDSWNVTSTTVCRTTDIKIENYILLSSPADKSTNSSTSIEFVYTPTFYYGSINNCSIWTNVSSWSKKASNVTIVTNTAKNSITTSIGDGNYAWGIECYNDSSVSRFSNNREITISTIPNVSLNYPSDRSQVSVMTVQFNYTAGVTGGGHISITELYFNKSVDFPSPVFDNYYSYNPYKTGVIVNVSATPSWENTKVLEPCILNYSNKIWIFYGADGTSAPSGGIGFVNGTALNSLVKSPSNPVLLPSGGSNWDSTDIGKPWVIPNATGDGTWYMWYASNNVSLRRRIGLATSPDGVSWTRYPENKCPNSPIGNGCVMDFNESITFEHQGMVSFVVTKVGSTFHMLYTGSPDQSSVFGWQIGYANSTDGVNWTKSSLNPVIRFNVSTFYYCNSTVLPHTLIYENDTFHTLFSGKCSNRGYGLGGASATLYTYTNGTSPEPWSPSGWAAVNDSEVLINETGWETFTVGSELEHLSMVKVGNDYYGAYNAWSGNPRAIGGIIIPSWSKVKSNQTVITQDAINTISYDFPSQYVGKTILWNVKVTKENGLSTFASGNYTFDMSESDTTPPSLTIFNPTAVVYNSLVLPLDVSANESVNTWWYSINNTANISFTPNSTLIFLTDGTKLLTVYANDSSSNLASAQVTFDIDTHSPSIVIQSPTNKSYNTLKQNLNITSSEPSETCVYNLNSGSNTTLSNSSATNWYHELSLSEGFYLLTVYCTDLYGNNGLNSTVYFTIDRTPPLITLYKPVYGFYNLTILQLEVSANESVNTWWYEVNGSANETFIPNTTVNYGLDGTKLLTVYANDSANNLAFVQVTVNIDTDPPDMAFANPTPTDGSVISQDYVFVNATANEIITTCTLEWNFTNSYPMTVIDGYYCYYNVTSLLDEEYIYYVTGVNLAHNFNQSVQFNVTVNVNPPKVTIFSPSNTTYYLYTLPLQVSANELIYQWTYNLNGTNVTFSPNTTITATEGTNHLLVYATDISKETKSEVWFYVNTTAPYITVTLPVSLSTHYSDENIDFSATTDLPSNSLCLSIDSNLTYSLCAYNTSTLSGYVTPLPAGSYEFVFRSNNTIGKYEWSSVNFTVIDHPAVESSFNILAEAGSGLANFLNPLISPITSMIIGLGVVGAIVLIIRSLASSLGISIRRGLSS